jgi:methylenetetrahydrofolate dehydrogenase (NAD+)
MSTSTAPKGVLLKSDAIASKFVDEVKQMLAVRPRAPKLVGILSTSSAPSRSYASFTRKQCDALGIKFELKETGAALGGDGVEGEGVEEAIIEANADTNVDGIMVSNILCMYPRFESFFSTKVYYPVFGVQQVRSHYISIDV